MCTQLEIGLHLFIFVTSVVGNLPKHCCLCQNFRDSPISFLSYSFRFYIWSFNLFFIGFLYTEKREIFYSLGIYIQFSTIVCWSVCLSFIYSWNRYQISVVHAMWILVFYSVIMSFVSVPMAFLCCYGYYSFCYTYIYLYIHTHLHIHVRTHIHSYIHSYI